LESLSLTLWLFVMHWVASLAGSGKTAAFLIPVLQKLQAHVATRVGARGVILSPTRELAQQTMKFAKKMAKFTDLRLCLLTGGATMNSQVGGWLGPHIASHPTLPPHSCAMTCGSW